MNLLRYGNIRKSAPGNILSKAGHKRHENGTGPAAPFHYSIASKLVAQPQSYLMHVDIVCFGMHLTSGA